MYVNDDAGLVGVDGRGHILYGLNGAEHSEELDLISETIYVVC